jgi:hypothetical protein
VRQFGTVAHTRACSASLSSMMDVSVSKCSATSAPSGPKKSHSPVPVRLDYTVGSSATSLSTNDGLGRPSWPTTRIRKSGGAVVTTSKASASATPN